MVLDSNILKYKPESLAVTWKFYTFAKHFDFIAIL